MDFALVESYVDVQPLFSLEFLNLIEIITNEDALCMPTTPLEAFDMYLYLTDNITNNNDPITES